MSDSSYIDAAAVARELLDGAEVSYRTYGNESRETRRVTLPDGRVATLAVVYDEDSGIGEWIGRDGRREEHSDDCFGTFQHRGADRDTGRPSARPDGFTGAARVFTRYGQGCDRLDGSVWWQPPADVLEQSDPGEAVESLVKTIDGWLSGDWYHVGLVVTITEDGEEVGSESIWGIEWGLDDADGLHAGYLAETAAELLEEAGIGKASSASVARWARDPLEAVARRVSGEDPGDADSATYHATLRSVVEWWNELVEDWDTYGDPLTTRIESDYLNHVANARIHAARRLSPESHHEDCDYRNSSAAVETVATFGLDESAEVFPCNLRCEEEV